MRYRRDGFSVDSARKKKRDLPQWYLDEPPDLVGFDWVYRAYRDLSTCRHPDGAIPWDKAMAYADRKKFEPDIADLLWELVRRMDLTEAQWRSENIKEGGGG